jgi:hypothetical protein
LKILKSDRTVKKSPLSGAEKHQNTAKTVRIVLKRYKTVVGSSPKVDRLSVEVSG